MHDLLLLEFLQPLQAVEDTKQTVVLFVNHLATYPDWILKMEEEKELQSFLCLIL